MIPLPADLTHLETAEAFLEHFGIAYDDNVVRRTRLHILQRFHDYLATTEPRAGDPGSDQTATIRDCLARAYIDFVRSDPLTERVFKVLRDAPKTAADKASAGRTFVSLDEVIGQLPEKE